MKLRKASSWQPAENWGPYGVSLILPLLNLWWDSSHCQHLDCSLTDDPLQPLVSSNAVAWGAHWNPLCTHKCISPNCRGVNACGTTVEHWSVEDMDTYFSPSSLGNAFHKVPQEFSWTWAPKVHSRCQLDKASLHWPFFLFLSYPLVTETMK